MEQTEATGSAMLIAERRQHILALIQREGRASDC